MRPGVGDGKVSPPTTVFFTGLHKTTPVVIVGWNPLGLNWFFSMTLAGIWDPLTPVR